MARPGIQFVDVVAAVDHLRAAGRAVNQQNVRSVLGRGSMTTINAHLRAIAVQAGEDAGVENPVSEDLPAELANSLEVAAATWFAQVRQALEKEVQHAREELAEQQSELDEVRAESAQSEIRASDLQREIDLLVLEHARVCVQRDELRDAVAALGAVEQELIEARQTIALQASDLARLARLESRVVELERLNAVLQEAVRQLPDREPVAPRKSVGKSRKAAGSGSQSKVI